jgi:hypothetical protein
LIIRSTERHSDNVFQRLLHMWGRGWLSVWEDSAPTNLPEVDDLKIKLTVSWITWKF